MTKNYINNLLQELHGITSLAGNNNFDHSAFQQKINALQQAIAQAQYLYDFIEYYRNGLEISPESLAGTGQNLQKVLSNPEIKKGEKIIAVTKYGTQFLLIQGLLLFQDKVSLTPEKSTKIYQTINILKEISVLKHFGYVEPKILECLCISAWHIGAFWLIEAIANLDLYFYHSVELKNARAAAYQEQNYSLVDILSRVVSPGKHFFYIKNANDIALKKSSLINSLTNQEIPHNVKCIILINNCATILLHIAQICCPQINLPIATHEVQTTKLAIRDLTSLINKINTFKIFDIIDISCYLLVHHGNFAGLLKFAPVQLYKIYVL